LYLYYFSSQVQN